MGSGRPSVALRCLLSCSTAYRLVWTNARTRTEADADLVHRPRAPLGFRRGDALPAQAARLAVGRPLLVAPARPALHRARAARARRLRDRGARGGRPPAQAVPDHGQGQAGGSRLAGRAHGGPRGAARPRVAQALLRRGAEGARPSPAGGPPEPARRVRAHPGGDAGGCAARPTPRARGRDPPRAHVDRVLGGSRALMGTAAEPRPAELPLPGGRAGASVRLHPLLTGRMIGPPGWVRRQDGRLAWRRAFGLGVPRREWLEFPVPAYLVEHPHAGAVLIDTGFHPSVAVDSRKNLGRLSLTVLKEVRMEPEQSASAQLRARGIEPAQVKVVIMTHLHMDHASAISDFPGATFVLSRAEWAAATSQSQRDGYVKRQFDHAFDYRLLDFEGPRGGVVRDIRPLVRSLRRRERALRLHAGPHPGPPLGRAASPKARGAGGGRCRLPAPRPRRDAPQPPPGR